MTCNNTQDLSEFGYRELSEAAKLLNAYCDGNKSDFLDDGIHIEFNPNSGCVFLVDEEFNVGMMNGDDLEQWHNCPECGEEGFLEDLKENAKDCCWTWMIENGMAEEIDMHKARVELGETSSGSCRLEDIVEGIKDLIPEGLFEEFEMYDESADDEAARNGIFEEITDYLDDIAPEGAHFGTQEGDGACYGFWKDEAEDEAKEA